MTLGRGDGPSAPTLNDDLGHPIRAADLAQSWTFRGGSSREDIFRTMSTGLNGTPMPSFADSLTPEQRWAITDFIVSLSGSDGPGYTNLVVAKHVEDPIDLAKGTESFESAPSARFPIVGQIMEPGRAFHPPATSVTVQAIYDAESIAFLVRWHDRSAEKTGKNGLSLPVPPEEEETGAGRCRAGAGASPSARRKWRPRRAAGRNGPLRGGTRRRRPRHPSSPTPSRFRFRRSRRRAPASRTSFSATARTRSISGSSIWPAPLRFSSLARAARTSPPNDTGDVTGVASYDQGEWSVIFKRPRRASSGAPFPPGEFLPIAFSVWDGFSRERGNRRGLTVWYSLYVEPEVVPSAVGPMVRTALIILAIELAVIGWVRWRHGSRARGELGGEPSQPATTSA